MAARKRAGASARDNGARAAQAYDGARRTQLGELQRARIVRAMLDVACEKGAGSVTVAHVVERSGVSRRTFYEAFRDREECFLAAFEQALAYAADRVIPAYEAPKAWRERIRAGLVALLALLDEEPQVGQVLIRESLAGGHVALERRAQVMQTLTQVVDEGRREAKGAVVETPLIGEGVVGGVLAVIQSRLSGRAGASSSRTQGAWRAQHVSDRGRRDAQSMLALTNPLMSMIVMPYLGAATARRELTRPVAAPETRAHSGLLAGDPFKEAGMRLTYRTVRVLLAIGEHADASNRQIGESAGIVDQGQISKLLRRLERTGLITNTGIHPGKGAPNSWTLTQKGRALTDSIRTHTPDEGMAA